MSISTKDQKSRQPVEHLRQAAQLTHWAAQAAQTLPKAFSLTSLTADEKDAVGEPRRDAQPDDFPAGSALLKARGAPCSGRTPGSNRSFRLFLNRENVLENVYFPAE